MSSPSRYTDAEREAAYLAMVESTAALAAWARVHGVDVKAARCVAHRWGAAHGLPTPTRAPSRLEGADLTRPTADLVREYGVTASRVSQVRTALGIAAPTAYDRLMAAPATELANSTTRDLCERYACSASTVVDVRRARVREWRPEPLPVADTPLPPAKATGATSTDTARELAEIASPPPVVRIGARFVVDREALDYLAPEYGAPREAPSARWEDRFLAAEPMKRGTWGETV